MKTIHLPSLRPIVRNYLSESSPAATQRFTGYRLGMTCDPLPNHQKAPSQALLRPQSNSSGHYAFTGYRAGMDCSHLYASKTKMPSVRHAQNCISLIAHNKAAAENRPNSAPAPQYPFTGYRLGLDCFWPAKISSKPRISYLQIRTDFAARNVLSEGMKTLIAMPPRPGTSTNIKAVST